MSRPDLTGLARDERTDLLELLRSLSEEQWTAPTLCSRWDVAQVAVHHVGYDEVGVLGLATLLVRGLGSPARMNDLALQRYADAGPDQVLDLVARNLEPRGLSAGFRGGLALTDGLIHHQDIRRALGLPRDVPEERLRPVLGIALGAPTLPARRNARGLTLRATDLDWSTGAGPEVEGPAEALLMAVAGRAQALGDLGGAGLDTLRSRVC